MPLYLRKKIYATKPFHLPEAVFDLDPIGLTKPKKISWRRSEGKHYLKTLAIKINREIKITLSLSG